ncbi:hypothetical protein [Hymenobacter arizonensis]|uniref:Lipoprotein n=1 Tax=Hymenobacter arizonensis TaxID=1227077 RepID=A0A1I6BQZ1_HYMAR|nr:hypothetical protein [Hymenobacter arizonensis]SFQ83284.1 hypothetical protein SAMN04515668_4940 [Hymenobacter arizonensis]
MRALPISLLLAASLGLSHCMPPDAETPPVAAVPLAHTSSSSGVSTGGVGPDPAQRSVPLHDILAGDTAYAATLPVLRDADGTIRLRVAVNSRAHTLEQTSLLFVPLAPGVRYQQIGRGVGRYDVKMGRYYFSVGYQKIRKRDDGRTDSGDWQEITGWVHPGTNAAAVAQAVAR